MRILRIGLIGQVNAGKSSVHESLLRYRDPAAVSAAPGWTREVRSMPLAIEQEGRSVAVAEVLDFPGFQRAEALERLMSRGTRHAVAPLISEALPLPPPGPAAGSSSGSMSSDAPLGDEAVQRLLQTLREDGGFRHEELIIEHARQCHVLLLIVDSREMPGAGFRAELSVLRRLTGARPIVLLNLTEHPASRQAEWRSAVRDAGCDDPIAFDAWHLAWANEAALWRRVAERCEPEPSLASVARAIAADRLRRRCDAERAMALEISELLVDAAAAQRPLLNPDDRRERDDAAKELMERARRREQACFDAVLSRLGFRRGDAVLEAIGATADAMLADPWSAREVARLMPGLVKGLAAGAVVGGGLGAATGFVLDLATLFTTIGAATVAGAKLGAAAGAITGGAYAIRHKLVDIPRLGRRDARLSPEAVELLGVRQLEMALGLLGRGHAALSDAPTRAGSGRRIDDEARRVLRDGVRELLDRGAPPRWSTLNGPVRLDDSGRVRAVNELSHRVLGILRPDMPPSAVMGVGGLEPSTLRV